MEIKYKGKVYEIEKKVEEQKVKPKGETDNSNEITVKNYKEDWKHTCEIDGNEFVIKWGTKLKVAVFGSIAVLATIFVSIIYYFFYNKKEEVEEK